jgi:hypothetical protein
VYHDSGGKEYVRFDGDEVAGTLGFPGEGQIRMPTAILSTYTGDGFIVAADGMSQGKDGTVTTRSRGKICQFGGNNWLAYAFAGRVAIGPDQGPEFSFDFIDTVDEAVQTLAIKRFATLSAYAARLAKNTQRILREACGKAHITFNDADGALDTILADVIISGYFKEVAATVQIEFYRHNRRFAKPQVIIHNLDGPTRIGSLLMNFLFSRKEHPLYHRYLRPLPVPLPHLSEAMVNAIIEARAYIKACESDEARKLDSFCKTIGGHIHIATITRTDGFQWVRGFKPKGIK